jgi:Tfp pilus assembly protein PilF
MKNNLKNLAIVTLTIASCYNSYQLGKQSKVNEIKKNMVELEMEWFHYQDVEKIVEAKNIWSEYED